MKFGENLYNLRKSTKMSQEKLAEEVGVSRQSVSKWENGESYPEMENILKLCKIFHCKINDLVHDDLQDIDSLDEDIKMSVVKLEKEKQKKLKVISKIIYVIAKIAKICVRIGIVCIAVAAIVGAIMVNTINIKDDKTIEVGIGSDTIEYKEVDGNIIISDDENKNGEIQLKVLDIESKEDFDKIIELMNKGTKASKTAYVVATAAFTIAALVLLSITLNHLEKLFKNINEGDTPFTLENVNHIKKMSYYMIAVTIAFGIASGFIGVMLGEDVEINVGFGLINILFLYSIAIIFEYGYQIQLDSKAKIYDEENEQENIK